MSLTPGSHGIPQPAGGGVAQGADALPSGCDELGGGRARAIADGYQTSSSMT
ncbi:hypothetical protein ACWD25_36225 [Streptomyces sp. NPDC002920]